MKARILIYDIESTNLDGDFGHALCIGYKWLDEKRIYVPSLRHYPSAFGRDPTNDKYLLQDFHKVMAQADIMVGYYATLFDLPWLQARMMMYGLPVLPPIPLVDPYFTARRNFKVSSRRLGNLIDFFSLRATKTRLSGRVWDRASAGHIPSIRYVEHHCREDINGLEQFYLLVRPLMRMHPNVAGVYRVKELGVCRTCGEAGLVKRGFQYTRTNVQQRVQCQNCGSWDRRILPKKVLERLGSAAQ